MKQELQRVAIVCTDPRHAVNAWLERWAARVAPQALVQIHRDATALGEGDFLFLVSCQQHIGAAVRARFRHTLVLHASALPEGRGMSPHVWQILEGRRQLTLTLLEAVDAVDAGRIWHQLPFEVPDTAVLHEINALLFDAEITLMDWALAHCDRATPRAQRGTPSQYRRRSPADSRIDPALPLVASFDLLRLADAQRHPAFFEHRGRTYRLTLEPL